MFQAKMFAVNILNYDRKASFIDSSFLILKVDLQTSSIIDLC